MNRPEVVITHHAVSAKHHTVEDVDQWHKLRWPNFKSNMGFWVGYHYVIDWDGSVTQTRALNEEGAHTIGMNTKSIGVCFMGNFDNHYPSPEQMESWDTLYSELRDDFNNLPTFPHRKYATKSCHGSLLEDGYFQDYFQKTTLIEKLKQIIALYTQILSLRRMK